MVRRLRDTSSLLFSVFFPKYKTKKNQNGANSQFGLPQYKKSVNDTWTDGFWQRPPAIPGFFFFLSQTHTCKIGGRQILVLHRRRNWHPESDTYYYNMFTCIFSVFFFVQQYQRGARQKWFTPRERKKLVKIRKYNYLCPAVTLHKWKERPTLDTKISQFLYIKQPVVALFRNQKRIFTFCLFFFDYFLQFQLSDAHQRALHQLLLFFIFCFTLQNYTSIHIFSSLNSCFDTLFRKQRLSRICWIPLTPRLRLQNSFSFWKGYTNVCVCHRTAWKKTVLLTVHELI